MEVGTVRKRRTGEERSLLKRNSLRVQCKGCEDRRTRIESSSAIYCMSDATSDLPPLSLGISSVRGA